MKEESAGDRAEEQPGAMLCRAMIWGSGKRRAGEYSGCLGSGWKEGDQADQSMSREI